MTTRIRIPRPLRKRLKALDSLSEVNTWGGSVDAAIVEILLSLEDTQRAITEITRSTGAATLGLHAANHRPGIGSDPLATAAPTSILGGTSSNSVGVGSAFARNDHSHDVATAAWSGSYSASAGAEGSSNSLLRADGTLLAPTFLRSSFSSGTLTLTDDATDQTLTASLGIFRLSTASDSAVLPSRIVLGPATLVNPSLDSAAFFVTRTALTGAFMRSGLEGGITMDDASTHDGTSPVGWAFGGILRCTCSNVAGATYTNMTMQCLSLQVGATNHSSGTHTFTERTGLSIQGSGLAQQSGGGTSVTVTDYYRIKIDAWPSLGTVGTITNARTILAPLPTLGSTIRRAIHISSATSNIGTEAANVEGIYIEDITRGTSRRAAIYVEGATTGTPTDVYGVYQGTAHVVGTNRYGFRATGATTGTPTLAVGFYADAHAVGTAQWAFYAAGDESYFSGTQMDDNVKHVLGTGRDAELYYDGTDFVCDPDVVGAGSFDIRGPLKCDSITNDTGLAAGVYTPTRSAEANITGTVTTFEAQYLRVGNTVTVSGRFTADPTLTATATSFEMTLPVASTLGATEDLAGVAFCGSIAAQGAEIIGSVANNTAVVQWIAADITSQTWSFTFSYQVI